MRRSSTTPSLYEGLRYRTPGLFLWRADQGAAVTAAAAAGASATIVLPATTKRVITRTLLATLPGRGAQRIVIDSHTDGTNVVEDNGPIAMTEMAAALAKLPQTCRARTVQFAFSTAHFYQRVSGKPKVRDGGSEQLAQQLDRDYDRGTVGRRVVLEHLGARQYDVVPRNDGPGTRLVLTNRPAADARRGQRQRAADLGDRGAGVQALPHPLDGAAAGSRRPGRPRAGALQLRPARTAVAPPPAADGRHDRRPRDPVRPPLGSRRHRLHPDAQPDARLHPALSGASTG